MRAQQDKNGGTAARDAHGQHAHSLFTRGVRGPDQMRTVSTRTARLHEGSGAEGGEGDRARTLQAQQRGVRCNSGQMGNSTNLLCMRPRMAGQVGCACTLSQADLTNKHEDVLHLASRGMLCAMFRTYCD